MWNWIIVPGAVDENRCDEKTGFRTGCAVRSQVIDVLEAQIKRRSAMKKGRTVAAKPSKKNLFPLRRSECDCRGRRKESAEPGIGVLLKRPRLSIATEWTAAHRRRALLPH
jgi:hypothetical protein